LAFRRQVISGKPQSDPKNDGHVDCSKSSLGETIVGEFWKISHSEFRYRPVGFVELGDVDAVDVDHEGILARVKKGQGSARGHLIAH
jgi:hypothetical protein